MSTFGTITTTVATAVPLAGLLVTVVGQFGRRHRLKVAVEVRDGIDASFRPTWDAMILRDAARVVDGSQIPVASVVLLVVWAGCASAAFVVQPEIPWSLVLSGLGLAASIISVLLLRKHDSEVKAFRAFRDKLEERERLERERRQAESDLSAARQHLADMRLQVEESKQELHLLSG